LTPTPFFSEAWFTLVAEVLQPLAAASPSAPMFSLVELYPTAPIEILNPGLNPGFCLIFEAATARVERGVAPDQRADVIIHAHWDDAARSAQLRYGPAYDALTAERLAAGRLSVIGVIPPVIAGLLRQAHDTIADHTLPWSA